MKWLRPHLDSVCFFHCFTALQLVSFLECSGQVPAKTFDSRLKLVVYIRSEDGRAERLGQTPTPKGRGLAIPPDVLFFVSPEDTGLTDEGLKAMVAELALKKIPGLSLNGCRQITDRGLAVVAELKTLAELNLANCRGITDAGIPALKDLVNLERLDFSRTRLTDAALKELPSFPNLEVLNLRYTRITDGGLPHLARMTKLKSLDLGLTRITDLGLEELGRFPNLKVLTLAGCKQITDVGLKHLKSLAGLNSLNVGYNRKITGSGLNGQTELVMLDLSYTRFSDGTSTVLEKMSQIERLYIPQTPIRNATMKRLQSLTRLREIDLSGCEHFNDVGIMYLKTLKGLKKIDLQGSKCSARAVGKLKAALPDLEVVR